MSAITVYKGYNGKTVLPLTIDGLPPAENAIIRAMFVFGEYCLDTESSGLITLIDDAQSVQLELGLVVNLDTGNYRGFLTVFDAQSPNGIPWGEIVPISVRDWQSCPL